MKLLFCSEHRLARDRDGKYWADSSLDRALRRYAIEGVQLTASAEGGVGGPGTVGERFAPIVHRGRRAAELSRFGWPPTFIHDRSSKRPRCAAAAERVVVRVPGAIGSRVSKESHRHGRPVLAELVGDPHDVFRSDASEIPLRPLVRWIATRQLRKVAVGGGRHLFRHGAAPSTEVSAQRLIRPPLPYPMSS